MELAGHRPDQALLDAVIGTLGLGDRLDHEPAQLSGGQQQRVACARALVSRPEIVFADEPTGSLDFHASAEVLALLRRAADEIGQTIAMVTPTRWRRRTPRSWRTKQRGGWPRGW